MASGVLSEQSHGLAGWKAPPLDSILLPDDFDSSLQIRRQRKLFDFIEGFFIAKPLSILFQLFISLVQFGEPFEIANHLMHADDGQFLTSAIERLVNGVTVLPGNVLDRGRIPI